MRILRQTLALTRLGLSGIPARPGASLVAVVGILIAVAVLLSLLSMGEGVQMWETGQTRPDRVIVVSHGATNTTGSRLTRAEVATMSQEPGIRRTVDGAPLVAAASTVGVDIVTKANERGTLYLLGINNPRVYPEIRVLSGHWPRPGLREIAVGRVAQRLDQDVDVGDRIRLRGSDWRIVGVFEDPEGMFEQTLFTDGETLLSAFGEDTYQELIVMLSSAGDLLRFRQAVLTDPTLKVDVYTEAAYRERSFTGVRGLLDFVSYFIGTLMAAGAVCAALSSLYASVDARAREISTLRAIGFGTAPLLASVVLEGLLLALGAAIAAAAIAWLVFNGKVIHAEGLTFPLAVRPRVILIGVAWAMAIGLTGACLPALRAIRVRGAIAP